jgi:hypothetical protein
VRPKERQGILSRASSSCSASRLCSSRLAFSFIPAHSFARTNAPLRISGVIIYCSGFLVDTSDIPALRRELYFTDANLGRRLFFRHCVRIRMDSVRRAHTGIDSSLCEYGGRGGKRGGPAVRLFDRSRFTFHHHRTCPFESPHRVRMDKASLQPL